MRHEVKVVPRKVAAVHVDRESRAKYEVAISATVENVGASLITDAASRPFVEGSKNDSGPFADLDFGI